MITFYFFLHSLVLKKFRKIATHLITYGILGSVKSQFAKIANSVNVEIISKKKIEVYIT